MMKISELIKRLQEIQDERGDIYVFVNSSDMYDVYYDEKYFMKYVSVHNVDW